jgi:hypothetical protein
MRLIWISKVSVFYSPCIRPISFPEHARLQVKGGHSSGEIELIQACDWLTADSTLDFQREFYACLTSWKYKQSIWNFSSKIWYFLHWNRLKTTRNSGENMYESFGLIGIQQTFQLSRIFRETHAFDIFLTLTRIYTIFSRKSGKKRKRSNFCFNASLRKQIFLFSWINSYKIKYFSSSCCVTYSIA